MSIEWEQKFPLSTVEDLTRDIYNHTPLLLDIGCTSHRGNNFMFRFELGWLTIDGFNDKVIQVWQKETRGATPMQRWQNKIRSLRRFTKGWAKNLIGENRNKKKLLLFNLDILDRKAETTLLMPQELEYKSCLNTELTRFLREEPKRSFTGCNVPKQQCY